MPTLRQEIIDILAEAEESAHALSKLVGIAEKEVCGHLEHIARSLTGRGRKLEVHPAACLECGFTFKDRRRFSAPSRCPRCRGEHLSAPRFRVK